MGATKNCFNFCVIFSPKNKLSVFDFDYIRAVVLNEAVLIDNFFPPKCSAYSSVVVIGVNAVY